MKIGYNDAVPAGNILYGFPVFFEKIGATAAVFGVHGGEALERGGDKYWQYVHEGGTIAV